MPILIQESEQYAGMFLFYKPLLMLVPLLSVFLGTLFGLRYHAAHEDLDAMLREAGEPGLSERQRLYLDIVRRGVIGAVLLFAACLLLFLTFGVSHEGEAHWSWPLLCGGHSLMSLALFSGSLFDIRVGVVRPWLRYTLLVLAVAGVLGAPVAAFNLKPSLMASTAHQTSHSYL